MRILSSDPRFQFETSAGSENDQAIIREVFAENVYRVTSEELAVTGRVVDLGANIGAFTVYCLGLREDAEVWAYEPEPHNYELLKTNLALNGVADRAHLSKIAVGAARGETRLTNEGGGSRMEEYLAGRELPADAARVPVITLEDVWHAGSLDEVDVLKVDVEGAETDLLCAAPREVLEWVRYLVVEYDQHGAGLGRLLEKLSETHKLETLGSHGRGAYVWARRY